MGVRKYINKSKRSFFKLGWFITLSFYVLKNVSFSQRSAIMGQNTAIILIFMILIKWRLQKGVAFNKIDKLIG
ncbi:hypothetical protein, partial [Klebsiella pneumoniae]|uniref:hypothetical protein n=1 Tax=Klebsiella pneumoniae TaxID=573 RepID=UPI001D11EA06